MKRFILAIVFVFCCSLGMTPPAEAAEIARLIAGAQLHVVERAGHLINIEAPAAFNERVLAFLLAQSEPARS